MTLGKLLLDKGLLAQAQLDEVQGLQRADGVRLDEAIVSRGLLTERQLLEVMSEQLHLPLVELEDLEIDDAALKSLPSKIVFRKRLLPLSRENGTLKVATSDAFDLYALDDVRMTTGLEIQPVLALREEIEKHIKTHYGLGGDTLDELAADEEVEIAGAGAASDDLLEMAQEASVI